MKRTSGILLPLSSLPSNCGIGTLGKEAYRFIDFLAAAGQSWWQLLPVGPSNCGDSPYTSLSTFAGNPYYIDPDTLVEEGYLSHSDIYGAYWGNDLQSVDYDAVRESHFALLRKAFKSTSGEKIPKLDNFKAQNARWLDNYSLYMALKGFFGMKAWTEWPDELRLRDAAALKKYSELLSEEIQFWDFVQFLFFKQWDALRDYAHDRGIGFIGDVPIYVALDSADVWSEPEFFQLDQDNVPVEVAGVPPDDFTDEGQLWGNPLYDYDRMKADGFGWWIRRIEGAQRLYDVIRIDHFRGIANYWAVPYGETSAKNGHWRKGPGMDLIRVLTQWFYGLEYIAEDLGCPDPDVVRLLDESGLPGMNVLQFAFSADNESPYLPHNIKQNSSCYVGTHDNNTIKGWIETLNDDDLQFLREYTAIDEHDEGWCWGLIRLGMATPARLFVATAQDILELGGECRMNIPGTPLGNWRWRMLPDALTPEIAMRLKKLTAVYKRI